MTPDWFDNDDLFFEQLRDGHLQAERVADVLRTAGLPVVVTPMEVRARVEERGAFADEYDLLVGARRPCPVDVKSRKLYFTGPDDFPYPTALVDTASGWEQKRRKPLAVVLISQSTGGLAVIRPSGASQWTRQRRFDNARRIHDVFLEVERERLATMDEFVAWLRAREDAVDLGDAT